MLSFYVYGSSKISMRHKTAIKSNAWKKNINIFFPTMAVNLTTPVRGRSTAIKSSSRGEGKIKARSQYLMGDFFDPEECLCVNSDRLSWVHIVEEHSLQYQQIYVVYSCNVVVSFPMFSYSFCCG